MNVALFPSAFHPSLGGVEELTRQLAHELRRQGHGVMVVTERWPRNLPEAEQFEGIEVRRFPMRVPTDSLKSRLTYRLTTGRVRRDIAAALASFEPDVLHVQCVSSTTLYALETRKRLRLPLVVTLQGELSMDAAGIFQRPGIAQVLMRRALVEAEQVTGCSQHTLTEAEAFAGEPLGERGRVVHNAVRLEELGGNGEPYLHPRPYILAIGRHVPQKGFDLLIRAYAEAGDAAGGFDLLLAGDGPERPALQSLVDQLNLSGRVKLVGRADRPTTAALFRGCQFFVLPSRHEPFGIVNLEAMAAGKAVLATRVGGVPEVVVEGETGLLVPGEDVAAMATGLRRLASDPGLRDRMGAAAARRATAFTWREITRQYLDVYAAARDESGARRLQGVLA